MREARFPRLVLALSVVGLILVGVGGAPSPAAAQGKRKLAMILPGPIQDADFNAVGYVALQELAKAYDLQVSHSESVAVADAERVSREYITSGYDIIAYHGGQFPTIMKKLAAQYPNVVFIQEGSGRMADAPANAWVIGRKVYQGLAALVALGARSTKTGKVGFVGDFTKPYREMVGRIVKGAKGGDYEMRPGSGMELSDIRTVPPEVAAKVRAVFREVVAGKPLPEITDKTP